MFAFVKNFQVKNVPSSLCITTSLVHPLKFAEKSNMGSSDEKKNRRLVCFVHEYSLNYGLIT